MHGRNTVQTVLSPAGGSIPRPGVLRLLGLQSGLGLLVCVLAATVSGATAALSSLAGLTIAVLPNLAFVAIAFRHRGARVASRAVADLYLAEACKFALTVIMFAGVFALLRPLAAGWLFTSYIGALTAYWFSPWVFASRGRAAQACG